MPGRVVRTAAALLGLLVASACTGAPAQQGSAPGAPVPPTAAAPAAGASEPAPAPPEATPTEAITEPFDPLTFTDPTTITNQWLPLAPGAHWIWDGEATVDGVRIARRVELTITDLIKPIGDLRTVVAYERDFNQGQMIEAELVFFAQDRQGNVWHLGQYPEEYEQGVFVEAPAWIHGFQGASAGIFMQADPQLGTPSYSQGWGPAVDWTDRAEVSATSQRTCVPVGCYDNVLVISEGSRSERDAQQLKFYAPGVGNVAVDWSGAGEIEQEVLQLTLREVLNPDQLAAVRDAARALEEHAYAINHEVYRYTLPIEPTPAGA